MKRDDWDMSSDGQKQIEWKMESGNLESLEIKKPKAERRTQKDLETKRRKSAGTETKSRRPEERHKKKQIYESSGKHAQYPRMLRYSLLFLVALMIGIISWAWCTSKIGQPDRLSLGQPVEKIASGRSACKPVSTKTALETKTALQTKTALETKTATDTGNAIDTRNEITTGNAIDTTDTEKQSPSGIERPRVALTFDDGPSCYTEELLDGLRSREVPVTFFLQGQCIAGREAVIRQMQKDGHLIGNHTYSHVSLSLLSDQKAMEEIQKTQKLIQSLTGTAPSFIRPPFGAWKSSLEASTDLFCVLWNIDSYDWYLQNTPRIVARIIKDVGDGAIILMHDCYPTSVEAAFQVIDILQKQGYDFVTAEEMLLA